MKNISPVVRSPILFYWLLFMVFAAWFGWEFSRAVKFTDSSWPSIPWGLSGGIRLGIFSFVVTGLFLVLRKLLGQHAVFALIAVGAVVAVGAVGVAPLFAVCAFLFSSTLLGEALTDAVGLKQRDFLHRLLQLALGAKTISPTKVA